MGNLLTSLNSVQTKWLKFEITLSVTWPARSAGYFVVINPRKVYNIITITFRIKKQVGPSFRVSSAGDKCGKVEVAVSVLVVCYWEICVPRVSNVAGEKILR